MQARFSEQLSAAQQRVNQVLSEKLADYPSLQCDLIEAMRYAVLLGGKRIRPFLVYATGKMLGVTEAKLDCSAAAIEAVHAYSLVHDDLPAMDNDDLRRGQPTCHIRFNEATAILAGDALQTFAFELISNDTQLSDREKVRQVQTLAHASGAKGMCIGQALDLYSEKRAISLEELAQVHRHKTGALILSAVLMGLNLSAYAEDAAVRQALVRYAEAIGLAFQVQDDILDIVGEADKIGKPVGADLALDKSTYPKLLGLDGARQKAQELHQEALDALHSLPFESNVLTALADFIVQRDA